MRLAAVDIGTNTVRLLAIDVIDGTHHEVARVATVVGLGVGVEATGRLDREAMDRALSALSEFTPFVAASSRCSVIATAASRDAANREIFFDQVESILGHRPSLITGEREAAFSFAGATSGRGGGPFLVVDIGGGSTELVAGSTHPEASISVQMGSVRLTERARLEVPANGEAVARAAAEASQALVAAPDMAFEQTIAVAGTFTSLAALSLELETYDSDAVHGFRLEATEIDRLVELLASLSLSETQALPTMEPRRAPYILAGAIVAQQVARRFGLDEFVVSERDLLDGVVASLLPQ